MFHGTIIGAWATQVPLLRERLALSPSALGAALFCASAGAVLSMPLTGAIAARRGTPVVIAISSAGAGAAFVAATWAHSFALLCMALFLFGVGFGAVDVAMNAQAVRAEKEAGRPILGAIHAMWSVGSGAGSAGGSALLLVLSPLQQAISVALVSTCAILAAALRLPRKLHETQERPAEPARSWGDRRVLAIGTVLFLAFAIEGAIADWSGIYLHTVRHTAAGSAALGYSAFSLCMVAMRFSGDRVRRAFGNTNALFGGFVSATGLVVAVAAPSPAVAIAGFGVAGIGAANVVPALFALAGERGGHAPDAAVGVAATLGYAGVLAGPPLFGAVAQATSLQGAIALIGGCCCLVGLAAFPLGRR